jgi:hypothetical protein
LEMSCRKGTMIIEVNRDLLQYIYNIRRGFKNFNQLQRRGEGFKRRNICNISSIESLGPTQRLGLRGGFETTSKKTPHFY